MLPKPESACFVIADISGYTGFLAGVELDHAHDIIADVMDTVVRRLRPPFRLAKFEGDAAFFYAVADKFDGSVLQDAIESAYVAFRKRLRNIKQASACKCSACSKMQDLDLKFVSHHGECIKHRMAGREELAGRDVILIHRLLKNTVNERFGRRAYALYSDPCIRAMGIDPVAQNLVEHLESIDIIGEVTSKNPRAICKFLVTKPVHPRIAALILSTVAPDSRAASMMRASVFVSESSAPRIAEILSIGTTTAPWRSAWMRSPLFTAMPCTVTSPPKSTTCTKACDGAIEPASI
jgi:hypothetical protein